MKDTKDKIIRDLAAFYFYLMLGFALSVLFGYFIGTSQAPIGPISIANPSQIVWFGYDPLEVTYTAWCCYENITPSEKMFKDSARKLVKRGK